MQADWYTKGVLTVIAFLLAMIAFKQYVSPDSVVRADGSFAGVQYSTSNGYNYFFDTRTGQIWEYYNPNNPSHYRLTKLGAPLLEQK